jgi:hypothetical protein
MLYALAAGRLADRIDESFVFPVLLNLIIEDIRSSDWRAAGAFALPAQALARRTGPEDAKIFFEELQKLLAAPPSEYHLQPFGNIGKALAERMSAAEARRLLPGVLDEIQRSKDTRRIGALAAIVDGWSAHLTPAQAETLFPTLLSTLTRALNEENGALARSLTAVAATLSEASAQRLLPSMLKLLADDQTGSGDSSAVAAAVGLVTGKVDRAAMAGAVAPMLRVVKIASAGPDQDAAIATLRRVVDAAGGLAPEHLQAIMAEIAWAQTPAVAAVWATALVQVAPRDPPEVFVATVVSALKSPPGAGEATPILLDGLRAAVPAAPGAAAGLHANLEWIARTFPGIDISGQPACPRPPRQGLQCPTVVARPTFAIGQSNVSFQ